jgi:hypothetical protein
MKRKTIFDLATDCKLTGAPHPASSKNLLSMPCAGIVMPGKPGVACVEGPEDDVKDFVSRIRVSYIQFSCTASHCLNTNLVVAAAKLAEDELQAAAADCASDSCC